MATRARLRKAANIGMCLVAVASIGWCGYDVWSNLAARHAIDSACDGLVPAGKVIRLPDSGGRVEAHQEGIEKFAGGCRVFSTEAGDSYGLNRGEGPRSFFEAYVALEPNPGKTETDDMQLVASAEHPSVNTPLGHGIPGMVSDSGVTVKLACGGGVRHDGRPVKNVVATTASTNDGHTPFATGSRMPQRTRDLLIATAVDMANRLSERLGCEGRLPEAPTGVDPAPARLKKAEAADETCAWYRKPGPGRSSAWLPDRVLETDTDPDVWTERCGLVVSGSAAKKALREVPDSGPASDPGFDVDLGDAPEDEGDWWASAQSWFGASAAQVHMRGRLGAFTHARPGEAGRGKAAYAWWASSTCHGKPAVHTLSLGNPVYAHLAAPHFASVFREYVTDVAHRHGCTDVKLPGKGEFTALKD
ncbi:hypothetical protein [Streptomyces iconiensis]|uniref:Uncharacterized protein n=1 Tax=Streptomyces iconiensis TaxID=1384038 RepID=A0ABT7A4M6_9ACTN|nr:hypothetical protein [Streptomyces iconiensis]MDJ1136309.1 hypothetical protein [Streptomyces iconiensis]